MCDGSWVNDPVELLLRSELASRSVREVYQGQASRAALRVALHHRIGSHADDVLAAASTLADIRPSLSVGASDGMVAPRVTLVPVGEEHLEMLYHVAVRPAQAFRWRFRGATPTRESFRQLLHSGVFVQFMVIDALDHAAYGLVVAYNATPDLGHCYLGFIRTSDRRPEGEVFEGMSMLIDHLFSSFAFRKVYSEVPGFNEASLGLAKLPVIREEGRLIDHDFHDGRWWDRYVYAIWREDWAAFRTALNGSSEA